jgi:phage shock protein C
MIIEGEFMASKSLTRPQRGRVLFGVCSGLANYFNLDVVLVRIVFILLAFAEGTGLILYLVGMIAIPPSNEKNDEEPEEKKVTDNKKGSFLPNDQLFGLLILIVGVIFLFNNFWPSLYLFKYWPLLLVAIGIVLLIKDNRKGE